MDALGLLGLSAIPEEFRDPIDDFRDPTDDFRDPIDDVTDPADDIRDPIDELRDPNQELEDFLVGKHSSSDVDNAKPIVRKARRLLNREVRVGVEDGRVFVGKLHCLDKQQNIILYDTVEFRSFPGRGGMGADGKPAEQRSLGLVLFPVGHLPAVEVSDELNILLQVWCQGFRTTSWNWFLSQFPYETLIMLG